VDEQGHRDIRVGQPCPAGAQTSQGLGHRRLGRVELASGGFELVPAVRPVVSATACLARFQNGGQRKGDSDYLHCNGLLDVR
jgi:hypothetical protein